MTVLAGHNLSKFYGPDEVFSGISVEVPPRSRIALVGPNGAGKTTLINLLIGADLPTEGTVQKARDARVSFLPQRPEMAGQHSIWEEQMKAFAGVREIEHEMNEWAALMADPKRHDEALEHYSRLQERFDIMGGYTYETKIRMVLTGVGFREEEYQTPLTQLSGGQKTRAMLCRLLLEEPDLLVLDEPTNHLDIYAVEWLESFLSDFPGAVLVISHDRYFIDHFATAIWEMDFGMIETYRGNYTSYTRQREERRERLQKEFDEQQEYIAKERDFIRKHMGSRWTAQAKGRLKKLNTMQKRGKIIERGPRDRLTMHLKMQESGRSGNQVVMTTNLTVGYSAPLVKVPDLLVLRGETVAIIGPNGAGKSTLLKTLIEQLAPIEGSVRLGANVKVGYFAQAHEGLDPNRTLLDEIFAVKMMPISEARNYLGAFMFSGDDVYRPVSSLSGGERGRVALAKLSLGGANLLLLDEPTNHLDIESQEILQSVLEDFNGAILLVSHDRYLIDRLATQIWDVRNGAVEAFSGTYQEYITARNQKALAANSAANGSKADPRKKPAQVAEKINGLNPFERKKRIAALEQEIEKLEKKLHTINETLAKTTEPQRVIDLGHDYNATEAALNIAVEEWGSLSGVIDLAALDTFIAQLVAAPTVLDAHNPYAGDDDDTLIRRANLRLYLHTMAERQPSVMLVMEAPGYRGCRITGVPVTSRKIIHEGLPELGVFGVIRGYRTTNDPGFETVYGEQSATIVWETMVALKTLPLIWNTYPFHPHEVDKPLTNRAPRRPEIVQGLPFLQTLITLFQPTQIIAVGNVAHDGLKTLGITAEKVRHPAQGGKNAFVAGLRALIG